MIQIAGRLNDGMPGEGMSEKGLPASDQPLPVMLQASRGHSIAGC